MENPMKKSEKIELRVNYAEKERLASIAAVKYPKWPGVVALCALGLSLFILAVILGGLRNSKAVAPLNHSSNLTLYSALPGEFQAIHSTDIVHMDGFSQSYKIDWKAETYTAQHTVIEISPGFHEFGFNLCRQNSEGCHPVGEAKMIFSPASEFAKTKLAVIQENGDPLFNISVTPTRRKAKIDDLHLPKS